MAKEEFKRKQKEMYRGMMDRGADNFDTAFKAGVPLEILIEKFTDVTLDEFKNSVRSHFLSWWWPIYREEQEKWVDGQVTRMVDDAVKDLAFRVRGRKTKRVGTRLLREMYPDQSIR